MKPTIATILLGLALRVPVLAQDGTIKITKYQSLPAEPALNVQTGNAYVELTTSKGTTIQAACRTVAPHPMQIPMGSGTTTPVYQPDGKPTLSDKDGKPLMSENNCAYLSEHVGENIDLFVGELNVTTMAKPEEVLVGKDDEGQKKAMIAMAKLFATDYVRAGRWQDAILFHLHTYYPPVKEGVLGDSTDKFVELKVLSEQATQTKTAK